MSLEDTIQNLMDESRKLKEEIEKDTPKIDKKEDEEEKNLLDEKKGCNEDEKDESDDEEKEDEKEDDEKEKDEEEDDEEEEIDMKEDVAALFNGEDGLTEEFKTKAETIFEAAVLSRIKKEAARIEENYNKQLEENYDKIADGLVEHIDGYLNLVVDQWTKDNEIALTQGVKNEIFENFIGSLKEAFEKNYIEIPEEKFDVLGEMESKIERLNAKLDEAVSVNVNLNKQINERLKLEIQTEMCEGLSALESEKLKALAEEIVFDNQETYTAKLQTIRENYFSKKTGTKQSVITENDDEFKSEETDTVMSKYVNTISRTIKK